MSEPSLYEKDTRMQVEKVEMEQKDMWRKFDKLQDYFQNKLPGWAVAYISILTFTAGVLSTVIATGALKR